MSTTENILSALGIAIIKEELTATPGSTDFLQFAYQVPVTEFSGKFTLHSQTTNVSFLYCYLLSRYSAYSSLFITYCQFHRYRFNMVVFQLN